ncbi:MAG: hypothetical protein IJ764_05665 [Bacteroidales bacterium]|nr:hypothetical protein [Bacteroidales bacterium]
MYLCLGFMGGLLMAGCSNSMDEIQNFERKTLPTQTIRGGHVIRSDKGNLQMVMDAPLILKYTDPKEKTIYPKGVAITFYKSTDEATAFFQSKYAVSFDDRDVMVARDSVMVIDYRSGDTTYLEDLVWNAPQKRIYSKHPLRSVNGSRITYGDSFESDDKFENPQIVRQRGTVEWQDE